jgi:hypothetical protein
VDSYRLFDAESNQNRTQCETTNKKEEAQG